MPNNNKREKIIITRNNTRKSMIGGIGGRSIRNLALGV